MDIWSLSDNRSTNLILWRSENNVFRVVQDGEFISLLTNSDYILIHELFASAFNTMPDQVVVNPVTIIDLESDVVKNNYFELEIINEIRPSTIHTMNAHGKKVWHHGQDLFVSGELKDALISICSEKLSFTQGFSHFAG